MKNDFDENNKENKEYGSSSLDYYNDEISRKAVGRLFEDIEGEIAASGDDEEKPGDNTEVFMPQQIREENKFEEKQINNHFYEESRVKNEPEANESIVRGFEREEPEERRPRRTEPRMAEPIGDAVEPRRPVSRRRDRAEGEEESRTASVPRTEKEEREKYRKQFLSEMENDRRPARPTGAERPRPAGVEKTERTVRPISERTERPTADRGERAERPFPQDRGERPRKKPGSLEEYRQEARKPLRPKKPEQEMEQMHNAEQRYSRRAQEMEPKMQKAKQAGGPGKRPTPPNYNTSEPKEDLLSQPIVKIAGGAGIVFLLILIFMGLKINSLSKELKVYREADMTLVADQATVDALNETIEDYLRRITGLQEDNRILEMTVANLTGGAEIEGEGEGGESGTGTVSGGGSYTVVSGDTLSSISQRFYGSSTAGVDKIKAANGLTSDSLQIGQVLTIPE